MCGLRIQLGFSQLRSNRNLKVNCRTKNLCGVLILSTHVTVCGSKSFHLCSLCSAQVLLSPAWSPLTFTVTLMWPGSEWWAFTLETLENMEFGKSHCGHVARHGAPVFWYHVASHEWSVSGGFLFPSILGTRVTEISLQGMSNTSEKYPSRKRMGFGKGSHGVSLASAPHSLIVWPCKLHVSELQWTW